MIKKVKKEALHAVIDATLKQGHPLHLKVTGRSMEPFWRDGVSSVTLHPLNSRELKKHDIIFYTFNNHYILHRIVAIDDQTIQTQGDNVYGKDYPIHKHHVLGIVTAYKRHKKEHSIHHITHTLYLKTVYPFNKLKRFVKMKVRRIFHGKKR